MMGCSVAMSDNGTFALIGASVLIFACTVDRIQAATMSKGVYPGLAYSAHLTCPLFYCFTPPTTNCELIRYSAPILQSILLISTAFTITSFSPQIGCVKGRTTITITGTGLSQSGHAWCRFGASPVKATAVTSTSIQCTSPTVTSPGYVDLSVSLNGQVFKTVSTQYRYYDIILQSVSPSFGPKSGQTVVDITATNVDLNTPPIKVQIKGSLIPTTLTSGNWNGKTVQFTMPDFSAHSLGYPYSVELRIAYDAVLGLFTEPAAFSFYDAQSKVRLFNTDPTCGPADGQTNTQLMGSAYVDTGEIKVKVVFNNDTQYVSGTYNDSNYIYAMIPVQPIAGISTISVALNGQQYTSQTRQFSYYLIDSITPDIGSVSGSTTVTIHGNGFQMNDNVMCRFGSHPPVTGTATQTEIICTSPPSSIGPVTVEVTCNGRDYTRSGNVRFDYYPVPAVVSFSPTSSREYGQDIMRIHGGPYLNVTTLEVCFVSVKDDSLLAKAQVEYVNSTFIQVIIPSIEQLSLQYPVYAHVRVRLNGQEAGQSTGDMQFMYYGPGSTRFVTDVSPRLVTPSSNTSLSLTGINFGLRGPIDCLFTDEKGCTVNTTGSILSATEISCVAPPWSSFANDSTLPALVRLVVPDNGGDYTHPQRLTYYSPFTITSIDPSSSPTAGGIRVTLHTIGVVSSPQLSCMFDKDHIKATFVSSELVQCIAPAHKASGTVASTVQVSLSLNDQYYHGAVLFNYEPCPAGQYSRSYTDKCTNCSAGYYAAQPGSAICAVCSIDHYCEEASVLPTNCPSNTVSRDGSTQLTDCSCRPGSYEPHGRSGVPCIDCTSILGSTCPGGTEMPYPQKGWWSTRNPGSIVFFPCPAGSLSCNGGSNATLECRPGYEGRMCSQCSKGYYKLEDLCFKCPQGNSTFTIVLGMTLFLAILFVLKRYGGLQQTGGAISVAVSYIQVTAVFVGFRLDWAKSIAHFLSQLAFINLNIDITAPECTFGEWSYTDRFIFTMLLPLFSFIIMLLWHCMSLLHYSLVHKYGVVEATVKHAKALTMPIDPHARGTRLKLQRLRKGVGDWLTSAEDPKSSLRGATNGFLFMLSMLYIILSTKTFEIFDCTEIANGVYSLDAYPEMLCWGEEHMRLVPWAIACGLLYVPGIPLLFFIILYRNRRLVKDPSATQFRRTFGAIYGRFSSEWYLWELVVLCRKLVMVLIKLYLTTYPLMQGALGEMVVLLALSLQMYALPFAKKSLNRLESGLLFCNFLVLLTGMMFHDNKFHSEALRQATELATAILLAVSMIGIFVFVTLDFLSILRAKRTGGKIFGDSTVWQYWSGHLPPKAMPGFLRWMEKADRKDIEAVRVLTDEIQALRHQNCGAELAGSVMEMTYDGIDSHRYFMSLVFKFLREGELTDLEDLTRYIHAIGKEMKRGEPSKIKDVVRWMCGRKKDGDDIEYVRLEDPVQE